MKPFAGRNILVGGCGGIAAYKVVDWVRNLTRLGAEVTVVMTESASRFVSPLTFAALSGNKVHTAMFDEDGAEDIPHIDLARRSDLILIAPATASTIARLAHGLADDLLTAAVLAAENQVVVCPAMNSNMYLHPATSANLASLKSYGYQVVDPGAGLMACGDEGPGRLPDWEPVAETVHRIFSRQDLAGRSVLITAGPTEEPLDPVRYLSNRSSGKMGYALARAAARRGADVTLVSGPTSLSDPPYIDCVKVRAATEMEKEVMARAEGMDVIIKSAAVSDFRPARQSELKIKKLESDPVLELTANQDILANLGVRRKSSGRPEVLVGFAAESHDLMAEGRRKLAAKNLDLIVVNDISADDAGFAVDTNRVVLISADGMTSELPLMTKLEVADEILDSVTGLLTGH